MTKAPPLKSQKGRAACPRLRRIRFSPARHEVALLYEHPRDSDRVIERDLNLARKLSRQTAGIDLPQSYFAIHTSDGTASGAVKAHQQNAPITGTIPANRKAFA